MIRYIIYHISCSIKALEWQNNGLKWFVLVVKSVKEINEKIADGSVSVLTASEMKDVVRELGTKEAAREVDVVTTGTFGAMCSSGAWLNFGHSDPPIRMERVFLNDVEAYSSVAAVDAYIGATQPSTVKGIDYGGGHVIEDMVKGKTIHLVATSKGTDCYPRKSIDVHVDLENLNQAILCNPRNAYQRYNAAINTSDRSIYTYMGKLLPNMGNITFTGAGEISPLINDPGYRTIGIGTRIFLGGGPGYIIGGGTQHQPRKGFGTLMVKGDMKKMSAEYLKGATFTKYGSTLFNGIGIPIPVVDEGIALSTSIADGEIFTSIFDYGVPKLSRPEIINVSYKDLKSGSITINGRDIKTSCISSFYKANQIAEELKRQIKNGLFFLSEPVEQLPRAGSNRPLYDVKSPRSSISTLDPHLLDESFVYKDDTKCIHCGLCLSYCPASVFEKTDELKTVYFPERCIKCRKCDDICPQKAIVLKGK